MPQRRRGEDPVPIHSTMVQGREEEELLELQEHLEPREREDGPDILQAQEQVVLGVEKGMEGEVLADVGERKLHQGDYEESEGRKEDKEGMEDSGPGLGNSLLVLGHGCKWAGCYTGSTPGCPVPAVLMVLPAALRRPLMLVRWPREVSHPPRTHHPREYSGDIGSSL